MNEAQKNPLHAFKYIFSKIYQIYLLSYHHFELYNLISGKETIPKIIGISESRIQKKAARKLHFSP